MARKGLPRYVELVPVKRTEDDRNKSHPRALLAQAQLIRENKAEGAEFEEGDLVLIVFDVDVFKGNEGEFAEFLGSCEGVADVAVTNPSFELFLLLHDEGAYERVIAPHADEILRNGYYPDTRTRFVSRLASETLGMNVKSNSKVGELSKKFEVAAKQEEFINQDAARAIGRLTSTVATTINRIVREGEKPADL